MLNGHNHSSRNGRPIGPPISLSRFEPVDRGESVDHDEPAFCDEVVFRSDSGEPFTTSLVIAANTDNDHSSVMRLIRDSLSDLDEFGIVGFEIRKSNGPGRPDNYAVLNEPQSTLLLTYMRNSPVVKDFKKCLVRGFYAMRQALAQRPGPPALTGPALMAAALIEAGRTMEAQSERIAELEPKAEMAERILDAERDWSVADTAKALTRAGIGTGPQKLFDDLEQRGWIYRGKRDRKWRVKQVAVRSGWMAVLPQAHYHPRTGVLILDPPQPRITPKGLQKLLADHEVPSRSATGAA